MLRRGASALGALLRRAAAAEPACALEAALPSSLRGLATAHPPPRGSAPARPSFLQEAQPPGWGSAGGGLSPFTPTKELVKRKSLFKRTAFIMKTLEHEAVRQRRRWAGCAAR